MGEFASLRQGLVACREAREDIMDKVEDCRSLATPPEQQEEQIEMLKVLLRESQEVMDTLLESRQKFEPAPALPPPAIKNEAAEQAQLQAQEAEGNEGTDTQP